MKASLEKKWNAASGEPEGGIVFSVENELAALKSSLACLKGLLMEFEGFPHDEQKEQTAEPSPLRPLFILLRDLPGDLNYVAYMVREATDILRTKLL